MNKIKLALVFLAAAAFSATLVVHAEPNREIRPEKTKKQAVAKVKPASTSVRERAPLAAPRQGYQMVIDVLDGFGGESESDNYRIALSSGGQPSSVGVSQSDSFAVRAGFAHASYVMHGDANADGAVGPGDIVYLINYLYRNGPEPCPMEAGDANCDDEVGPGDIVYLLNYLYRGGPPPPC